MAYGASTSKTSRLNAAHLAWIAMFCSILTWGIGEVKAGTLGNTGNWYRIGLVLLSAVVGIFALLKNTNRLSKAFPAPLLLFLLYGLVAMISSAYIPEYSLYSMWKAFEVIVDVLLIAALLSYPQPRDSARVAYSIGIVIYGILICVTLMEAAVVPSSAFVPSRGLIPYSLHGVFPFIGENGLAFLGAVVAFAAWCRFFRPGRGMWRKLLSLIVLGLALLALVLAQSRTSFFGFLVAVCVFLFFDRRYGLFAAIAMAGIAAVALTTFSDTAQQYIMRGQSKELFTSLSGRTHGWEAAWASFQQSPLIGHGFAAAARVEILGTEGPSTLHGSIFDVLVGVGLLGLIPWALGVLWTCWRMLLLTFGPDLRRDLISRSKHAEMLGLLALIVVRSSTSSGLAMHDHTLMFFLAVLAYAAAARQPLRQAEAVGGGKGARLRRLEPKPAPLRQTVASR